MSSIAYTDLPAAVPLRKSAIHRVALFIVWLSIALSGIVFEEPAPVDFLWMMLAVLLPVVGLARTDRSLLIFISVWMVVCACGYLSAIEADELRTANTHISITLFLSIAAFTLGCFICANPEAHTRLIVSGMMPAGIVAAVAAVVGILSLVPGAYEIFTKWDRATGTFKDPNVFSAFLVPAIIILLDRMVESRPRYVLPYGLCSLVMMAALVLSLSRGAFFNLAVAATTYLVIRFMTFRRSSQRLRIVVILLAGAAVVAVVVMAALSLDKVGSLLTSRIGLQEYDVAEHGRFAAQLHAINVILEHPQGIGPLQFSPRFHLDSPHNVYLSMSLHTGWLGGLLFVFINVVTLVMAFRNCFVTTPVQGIFMATAAAFFGVFLEGFIIDTDHWRHLFVLYAIIWGLSASPLYRQRAAVPPMHVRKAEVTLMVQPRSTGPVVA